ncbi:MAG: Tab2 family RNA-binding protein, partial [Microcystaceae cyanobacterium]
FNAKPRPIIRLETGVSDSWILANVTNANTLAEAEGFEQRKTAAQGLHFLAIQDKPDAESFAGFWLLQETSQGV